MDRESDDDRALCATLPAFVDCMFEAEPDFLKDLPDRGKHRVAWSLFHLDQYSDADWLAIVDADVVFFTFGIPHLLFDYSSGKPKPVVFANWVMRFILNPLALGLDWIAEFMDSYP